MREELLKKVELFADNRDLASKAAAFESAYMYPAVAGFYTVKNEEFDKARFKECGKTLSKNMKWWSSFRSHMTTPVTAKMALQEDPVEYLNQLKVIYDELLEVFKINSYYLALTSMIIYDQRALKDPKDVIAKTKDLLMGVKKDHPFITSRDDLAMLSLLAMSEKEIPEILNDVEECYQIIHTEYRIHADYAQTVAFVLAMNSAPAKEKCSKLMEIFDALERKDVKYGKGYELAVLAAMLDLPVDASTLASEICEASDYLATRKGFGALGTGKKARAMYAAMMVSDSYQTKDIVGQVQTTTAALSSAIAAQVALMCAVVASTTAAASSSS